MLKTSPNRCFGLIIDTSLDKGYVAIFEEYTLLEEFFFPSKEQSKSLLPHIDRLLQTHELTLKDVSYIAVCTGPGSFTGTRIGATTAQALSYGLNIKLFGFNSLIPYHTEEAPFFLKSRGEEGFILDKDLYPEKTSQNPFPTKEQPPRYDALRIIHYLFRYKIDKEKPARILDLSYLYSL